MAAATKALVYSRLESLKGNGQPAVAVVVYGNQAYEDALLEAQTLLTSKGFQVVMQRFYW